MFRPLRGRPLELLSPVANNYNSWQARTLTLPDGVIATILQSVKYHCCTNGQVIDSRAISGAEFEAHYCSQTNSAKRSKGLNLPTLSTACKFPVTLEDLQIWAKQFAEPRPKRTGLTSK